MYNNFLLEVKKDVFFKKKQYSIQIDGIDSGILSFSNTKKFISLSQGKHTVKIISDNQSFEEEINIKNNKLKRFYIKPSISLQVAKGFFIVASIVLLFFVIYSFFVLDNRNITYIPIFLILISFSSNKFSYENFRIQRT
jgi:hypothetical protein